MNGYNVYFSFIILSASINGHVGVLHYVQNRSDIDWIINKGKHAPYVPLFASDQFDE